MCCAGECTRDSVSGELLPRYPTEGASGRKTRPGRRQNTGTAGHTICLTLKLNPRLQTPNPPNLVAELEENVFKMMHKTYRIFL